MFIKSVRENFLSQSKGGVLLPYAINKAPETRGGINEKTFRDCSFGFDGLLAQMVERMTLNH